MSPGELAGVDVAAVNLACAAGLPGAENLDVAGCLATLDKWTDTVRRYTRDATRDYYADPTYYHDHKGFFCLLSMITMLKRGLGVTYQPTAVGNYDFSDSRDDLLHGLLTRKLGTCASLPVLFVAIGRRLDYPVHLAVAKGHVFCQWVNPDGSRLNFEGSGPGGGEMRPDEHFHRWPRLMTAADLASGLYLRPLVPVEQFALFLETRGHCWADNGRFAEARVAYEQAGRVAPGWSACRAHLGALDLLEIDPPGRWRPVFPTLDVIPGVTC